MKPSIQINFENSATTKDSYQEEHIAKIIKKSPRIIKYEKKMDCQYNAIISMMFNVPLESINTKEEL